SEASAESVPALCLTHYRGPAFSEGAFLLREYARENRPALVRIRIGTSRYRKSTTVPGFYYGADGGISYDPVVAVFLCPFLKTFNKRLDALIDDSAIRIHGIRTKEEVLALVRAFKKYERKGRVGFDHAHLYGMSSLLLGISIVLWLLRGAWPATAEIS